MKNSLLLIDLITGSLNVLVRANAILQTAATENRDVTDEELGTLKSEADQLERDILNA